MMFGPDRERLIDALVAAAGVWANPDYARRSAAVEDTLKAENTFTEEAVAFSVNQQMSLLTKENIEEWLRNRRSDKPVTVGVLNAANLPMVDLQDFLAVVLAGHRYLGSISSRSPSLLPSFVDDVKQRYDLLEASFGPIDQIFAKASALIATGSDETMEWAEAEAGSHGIRPERRLLRGRRFAAAVTDGREDADEYEQLAEDILLHEGFGCRNVAVVWAPRGLDPDKLLEALAHFRAVFPAHASTPGRLQMQRAFLAAVGAPHAYGEGLEFLLSRGDPEPQQAGHVRWSEYDALEEVSSWISTQRENLQLVIASPRIGELTRDVPIEPPGSAQRPSLYWRPDGRDTIDFLVRL